MATGVNVKMGVSGVAQFKQGMKESQAAVKNLDQQLKLNEQQLKLNGDAEVYLQNKTKLLEEQIAKQKEVCKNAQNALEAMRKNGVAETSAEFQRMQTQMYKASTDLMEMQTQLQNVGEAGDTAANGVSEMNSQIDRVAKNSSWDNITSGVDKITGAMKAAAETAARMGRAIIQATLGGGQWADELATTATQWEMTPEQVYRMRQTANIIDTDAETIYAARKKLVTAMGKDGNKETMGAFAALGISDLSGTDENIENVFWSAGEALMKFDDEVAKNEYAMKLFGKSWDQLIPIFTAGRDEYNAMMESWTWIGDEQFESLTKLDDASQKMNTEFEALKLQFESTMADVMTPVMETLTGLMKEFNEYLQSEDGQRMLDSLGQAVSSLFSELGKIDPEQVVSGLVDVFNKITAGFEWIIKNKQGVFDALKYIAGGFALMKIAGLAANIGKIVSGLGGLNGGGGGGGTSGGTNVPAPEGNSGTGTGTGSSGSFFASFLNSAVNGMGIKTLFDLNQYITDRFHEEMDGLSLEEQQEKAFEQTFGITQSEFEEWKRDKQGKGTVARPHKSVGFVGMEALTAPQETGNANFVVEDIDDFITAEDKMTQTAGEMTDETAKMRLQNHELTHAAMELTALPDQMLEKVKQAIMDGMSTVTIVIGEDAIDTIGNNVIKKSGTQINALVP